MIDLVALVRRVLSDVAPEKLVHEALSRPTRATKVLATEWGKTGLVVVAVGKAATSMMEGAHAALGPLVRRSAVVFPAGSPPPRRPGQRSWLAPHPLPNERSVRAARGLVSLVRRARLPVLALVSGGASSLVAWPVKGISLEKKRSVVQALLASGAPIEDVNLVRRHLSRIKGGGLLRAAHPFPVHTLVISDVVAGRASDVGSGPSLPSPRGLRAARVAARRWLGAMADTLPLVPCVGPRDVEAVGSTHELLVSPERFARKVAHALAREGIMAAIAPAGTGDLETVARRLLVLAGGMRGPSAVVLPAEPTLVLPQDGVGEGGRASHLALRIGPHLPRGVRALVVATDGVDGTSGHAGALVRREAFVGRAAEVRSALSTFDTGTLASKLGVAITMPQGHNLTDLVVLVRDT
jgi:glycerate 2-kinase